MRLIIIIFKFSNLIGGIKNETQNYFVVNFNYFIESHI
jgi:hypothetical protein